ncbi:hypothetical protein BRADI_4g11334v3 [Brachypodium distachyon]|uniref:Uncharacterized protein n=1 Tax=Brachypodium distachyon TaxID=15368 RepID=A0A2K2CM36_BRADI|nr:hypothetical protein BRADI_4g11334v3 [Brachypodium distachyon]
MEIPSGVLLQEESLSGSDCSSQGILTLPVSLPGSAQWRLLKVLDFKVAKA